MSDEHETAGAVLALVTSRTARYKLFADTWPALVGPRLAVELLGVVARVVEQLAREREGMAWRRAPVDWRLVQPALETAERLFNVRTLEARA